MKNPFRRGQKMPGNQDPEKVKAQKALQAENDRKAILYGVYRTLFEIQCIALGLEEVAVLSYEEGGLIPRVVRRPYPDEEQEKRFEYMQARLRDFHQMSKMTGGSAVQKALTFMLEEMGDVRLLLKELDNPPPEENKAGLVGPDGVPLDTAKKELLKELEELDGVPVGSTKQEEASGEVEDAQAVEKEGLQEEATKA